MNELEKVIEKIAAADAILIGASNGLSIAEGYSIFANDERFRNVFGDFREKYGIRSVLEGAGIPFDSDNEMWSYFSRLAKYYSQETPLMNELFELIKDKPYFVLTSNIDGHFQKAGFDPEKVLELEGNLNEMYCANHCQNTVYSSTDLIDQMLENEKGMKIPDEYLPKCPNCGGSMKPHLPEDIYFLKDKNYDRKHSNLQNFLNENHGKNIVILELGIGPYNQMIKQPLMQLAYNEPNAEYITFNKGEIYIAPEIRSKSIGINGNLTQIIPALLERKQ